MSKTVWISKRQLISRGLFGILVIFQKRAKKFDYSIVRKKNQHAFVRFLEESSAWNKQYDFFWPLEWHAIRGQSCLLIFGQICKIRPWYNTRQSKHKICANSVQCLTYNFYLLSKYHLQNHWIDKLTILVMRGAVLRKVSLNNFRGRSWFNTILTYQF